MAKQYKQRPSEIIGLKNDYEAFCFDEACTYILSNMQNEDSPRPKFIDDKQTNKNNNNDVIEWLNANNKN
ncbi:hypothetical protein U732_1125 [Clostridium argentinense CDC 2741]|uniref:Uncharacterized protein n=1 Tax=Clostridium argentinense CDC 2741 TaxID=1418104 RepID=A0A0C1U5X3_9CLOT|nr:hypothetical protein [Clostridium argentinense]ARC85641.1 hypothetical protein RSJ17_14565 [Clostridium argentinense]KIE47163.1 hypothetical protein U732_1125 [Clostridium argentinense CDC 2741]NFF40838.1 hypothetical protein [Clostridium argentinense]NFP50770.1 hypothetical protein [Clostridium argentinense]NFP73073.1 hypothetical protein [Clostridium argentinense]